MDLSEWGAVWMVFLQVFCRRKCLYCGAEPGIDFFNVSDGQTTGPDPQPDQVTDIIVAGLQVFYPGFEQAFAGIHDIDDG